MSKSSVNLHSLLFSLFLSGYFLFSFMLNRCFILTTVSALRAWIAGEPWTSSDPGFQRLRAKNTKTAFQENINYKVNNNFSPSGYNLCMPEAGEKLCRGEAKHFAVPWEGSLAPMSSQFNWTNSPWQLLDVFCVSADFILGAKVY